MAHRGDKKGKGDRGDRGSKHSHNYVEVRRVKHGGKTYVFLKCNTPGCPDPNKMNVEYNS